MNNKIPNIELSFYFFVWTVGGLYCLHNLYLTQTDIYKNRYDILYHQGNLELGWKFIGRFKDISDLEWSSWKFYIQNAWIHLVINFIVSEIIRSIYPSLLKYWYIISSLIFISNLGYKHVILILLQPIIFTIIIFTNCKKATVWVAGICLLIGYNSLKYKYYFWYYFNHENLYDEEVYMALFTVAWTKLRCISFCIDYIDKINNLENKDDKTRETLYETVLNMFSYILYMPVLFFGPVILYEDFAKSFGTKSEKLTSRLKVFFRNIFLYLIYSFVLDCALHFIYLLAMEDDIKSVEKLHALALCGGGLWMGLEFHMKYVISYGTSSSFARLDNIDAPPTPRCVVRIHIYSQMWRYFDVGLYIFLVKYIHKPSLNLISKYSRLSKTINRLLASLVVFIFIFMWHGTSWKIFVWTILNYFGIVLEQFGKSISETSLYKLFKSKILKTDEMETRFVALMCAPMLAFSALTNFYLLGGHKIANVYVNSFFQPTLLNFILIGFALYCSCHVAIALQKVPSRTDVKKSKVI